MVLEKELLDKLDQISVWRISGSVEVENESKYRLVGKGHQGAVFQIDDQRCVKIYSNDKDYQDELHALQLGQKVGICPKLYFWGNRFIVMEYYKAPSLFEYLQQKPLTKELSQKIIDLLESFKEAGYNRFDHPGRHIFVLPGETLKIIDVVSIIKEKPVYLVDKLLRDMGKYAEDFLQYTKEISPSWYNIWVNHPDFEAVMERVRQGA